MLWASTLAPLFLRAPVELYHTPGARKIPNGLVTTHNYVESQLRRVLNLLRQWPEQVRESDKMWVINYVESSTC